MASTITLDNGIDGRYVQGNKYVRKGAGNVGIYATGGVAVSKAQFELPVGIDHLDIGNAGGIIFEFDKTNSKIKAFRQKDPAAAGGADIALPEVANAVDLSAIPFRFLAYGN